MELARTSHRALFVVGAATVIALAILLGRAGPPDRPRYYLIDELVARAHDGDEVKAHGFVVPGSIVRCDCGTTRFVLSWRGAKLPARTRAPLPDQFRDQAEVIVTGTLRDGTLDGVAVIAKCSHNYRSVSSSLPGTRFE